MLGEQRRALIQDTLSRKGSVSVTELHRKLKVSRETIRRDINRMASENRLQKTHGGALSAESFEPAINERMAMNAQGKRAIGKLAATLVADGASLIINPGTTTMCLADALSSHRRLTVYTNDIHIVSKLAGRNDNRVLLLGGEIQGTDGATLGRDTTTMLENYFADITFIGTSAFSSARGLTEYTREAAELTSLMLAQARTRVLLADHTKFERDAPVRVKQINHLDTVISDDRPGKAICKALESLGAEIIVPEES